MGFFHTCPTAILSHEKLGKETQRQNPNLRGWGAWNAPSPSGDLWQEDTSLGGRRIRGDTAQTVAE